VSGVASGNQKAVAPVVDMAPDFDLPALVGGVKKRFHLRDQLMNRIVVLAFYPANWEAISTEQLTGYQAEQANFAAHKAEVVTVCADSIMNTTAWEREIGPFEFPMCSDFWPHGTVSRAYGVFRERAPFAGGSERAVFIVQPTGRIAFRKIYGVGELAPVSEVLEVLRKL
jgi:mycoredoxin-dependent peroxiredoxin